MIEHPAIVEQRSRNRMRGWSLVEPLPLRLDVVDEVEDGLDEDGDDDDCCCCCGWMSD